MKIHSRYIGALLLAATIAAAQEADPSLAAEPEAAASPPPPNLLMNGGFDELTDRSPSGWDLYIGSGTDARGSADPAAKEGAYCAMIEVDDAHPANPVMNWSQNILSDLAGKTIEVSGFIRTENASEAALWLQCWAVNPLRVVHGATTFDQSPVYGTQDWQFVAMPVRVPASTQFVTVRCVLRGRGRAWFDKVLVTIVSSASSTTVARRDEVGTPPAPPPAIRAPSEPEPSTAPSATSAEIPAMTESQRAQAAALAATMAANRSLGQLLSEPEAERDTILPGAPWNPSASMWPPGLNANANMLQWLAAPSMWPVAPVHLDQEQRR